MNKSLFKAIAASVAAGEVIMDIYNDPNSDFQVERKSDNSPLTIADKKSHNIISEYLSETPYPILSEEGRIIPFEERNRWPRLWIIDPLDGTKEFLKKNGEFTVNVALVERGVPVMGVIYLPVKKTLYFSEMSIGAYKTDNIELKDIISLEDLIRKSIKLPIENSDKRLFTVVTSRSHFGEKTGAYVEKLKEKYGDIGFVRSGSSIKIAIVAEGSADVYPRFAPTMEWDTAAGHAIANAAGVGIYRSDMSEELEYNKEDLLNPSFIVTNKKYI